MVTAHIQSGWRNIAAFWTLLIVCLGAAGGVLELLGPPASHAMPARVTPAATEAAAPPAPAPPARPAATATAPTGTPPAMSAETSHAPADSLHAEATQPAPAATPAAPTETPTPAPHAAMAEAAETARPPGTPIPAPQANLLQPAPDFPGASLPRTVKSPDGMTLTPMQAYAGGSNPRDTRPRVALILAGLGLSESDTAAAVAKTPAGVSLAWSPYAVSPNLDRARALGHEIVLSIPMEPAGYPLEDAGSEALLTSLADDVNDKHLEWVLSRLQGYAGTTGALGAMHGERFARSTGQMNRLLAALAARGLYYIAPEGSDAPTQAVGRTADLTIDSAATNLVPSIDSNLDALVRLALDRGSALGLAGTPRPVTVQRIAAWADRLATKGVVLVPVTGLIGGAGTAHGSAQLGALR